MKMLKENNENFSRFMIFSFLTSMNFTLISQIVSPRKKKHKSICASENISPQV